MEKKSQLTRLWLNSRKITDYGKIVTKDQSREKCQINVQGEPILTPLGMRAAGQNDSVQICIISESNIFCLYFLFLGYFNLYIVFCLPG